MTAITTTKSTDHPERPRTSGGVLGPLSATWAMIRRNLIHISRAPMQLSDVTLQPVGAASESARRIP